MNGRPWLTGTPGMEKPVLPVEWNGATCLQTVNPDVSCDVISPYECCICIPTGKGWCIGDPRFGMHLCASSPPPPTNQLKVYGNNGDVSKLNVKVK